MFIEFVVEGKPQGKARPRFTSMGGFVRTYSTKETVSYEEKVKKNFIDAIGSDFVPPTSSVWVTISARFEPPKSTNKKNKQLMLDKRIDYRKKPDLDNIAKIVCDALNGIAYQDDSQIVMMKLVKSYSDKECLKVMVGWYSDEDSRQA